MSEAGALGQPRARDTEILVENFNLLVLPSQLRGTLRESLLRQPHEGLFGVQAIEQIRLIRPNDADQLRCQTFFGCNGKIAIVQW